MQIKNNKIINTQNLEAGVFLLMGGLKTVDDYRSVGSEYKRKILLNDVVVLASSSAGMLGYKALAKNKPISEKILRPFADFCHMHVAKFQRSDFYKRNFAGKYNHLFQPIHTSVEYSKEIVGGCVSNVLMVAAGLFSAIIGDWALTKTGFGIHQVQEIMNDNKKMKEPKKIQEVEAFMKQSVDSVVTKGVRREMVSRVTDMPFFSLLTKSFIGLEGLNVTDEEKYSKQVKNASKYLVVNSLVPLFFLSISSTLTKKMKNIYRFPIMFTSLVAGTYLVKKVLDHKVSSPKNNS